MAFDPLETSVQDSHPVEIYDISLDQEDFFFTSSDRQGITFALNTYLPAVIERSQPKVNSDQPGSEIQLIFSTNDPIVQSLVTRWVTAAPEINTSSVVVRKFHVGDTEFQPFWFGKISSINYQKQGTETVILCRSLSDLFTRQGPRKTWGTACNHQLYDNLCRLSRPAFTDTDTVASISSDGLTFTMNSLAAPTVRYNAGEFRKLNTADSRLIVLHSGNDITVQYPIPSIGVGDTVQVIEGCEHNLTDCAAFPNGAETSGTNIENYGGSPYTPPINPFTKGLDAI